jgi:hypothetical protein
VASQDEEDDETEGLIIFPPYHNSLPALRHAPPSSFHREDLEPELSSESFFDFSDDSSCSSSPSETESESELSSRSSSPSLEDKDFDCTFDLEEDWSRSSCATPTLSAPPFLFAEDDIALHVAAQPAHGVDFLAHEWKTDDLWATYKHVHSQRENIRASKRLENALWRASIRNMRGLRRVDPEVIHWCVPVPKAEPEKKCGRENTDFEIKVER